MATTKSTTITRQIRPRGFIFNDRLVNGVRSLKVSWPHTNPALQEQVRQALLDEGLTVTVSPRAAHRLWIVE